MQEERCTHWRVGARGPVPAEPAHDTRDLQRELSLYTYEPQTAWMGGVGASMTYKFRDELGVTLYTDYHYARPSVRITYTNPDRPEEQIRSVSQVRTFDYLSAGLRLTAFF